MPFPAVNRLLASPIFFVAQQASLVMLGYVLLVVSAVWRCRKFWLEQVGRVVRKRTDALKSGSPSICFPVEDLEATCAAPFVRGVQATEVGDHLGLMSFASDACTNG